MSDRKKFQQGDLQIFRLRFGLTGAAGGDRGWGATIEGGREMRQARGGAIKPAAARSSPRRRDDEEAHMTTLFAFLHHLMAFTLVAAIAVEFMLIRQPLTPVSARRIVATDAVLGASATVLLVVGLLRVFYFEKGETYYFSSHAFLTKLGLFILLALLSAIPTVEFLSWRPALKAGQLPQPAPKKLRMITGVLHAELAGIVIILLCAAIMARGGWV